MLPYADLTFFTPPPKKKKQFMLHQKKKLKTELYFQILENRSKLHLDDKRTLLMCPEYL